MIITPEDITDLCRAYGYLTLGPQKNKYMLSFRHEESHRRLNVYYTTMTVTIEDKTFQQRHFRNVSLGQLEIILLS